MSSAYKTGFVRHVTRLHLTWHIHTGDVTSSRVAYLFFHGWHDSFTSDLTHSYVLFSCIHDSHVASCGISIPCSCETCSMWLIHTCLSRANMMHRWHYVAFLSHMHAKHVVFHVRHDSFKRAFLVHTRFTSGIMWHFYPICTRNMWYCTCIYQHFSCIRDSYIKFDISISYAREMLDEWISRNAWHVNLVCTIWIWDS